MKKIFAHILFRLVLVVIGFHAIIPHPHSDELSEREHRKLHQNSTSILGFLRYIFHESNDDDLDNIVFADYGVTAKITQHHKHPRTPVTFYNSIEIKVLGDSSGCKENTSYFHNKKYIFQNGLRAPPYYSITIA